MNEKLKFYWTYLVGFFLILALPLLSFPPWFSPPDWGKTVVFRIIFSILIFFFIWQLLNREISAKEIKNKFKSVTLPLSLLIAFAGLIILSTIFSAEPSFSFFGSPYRSGGSLNFILYIILAILLFLLCRQKDWMKIWNFSIIIGLFVSIIAFLQALHLFSKILIPYTGNVPSTIGGPAFLGIYLLLLSFPTLSFALKEKNLPKKIFYFVSFLIFTAGILVSQSQAAYLSFGIGIIYFFLFYPKKLTLIKIAILILIILGIGGVFYVRSQPENPLNKISIFQTIAYWKVDQSRLSAWKISLLALKDRPFLGYGPENFSIPFDKYYDPTLPALWHRGGGWWDRAHNFLFEYALTLGIPALIIYLLIFAVLFFLLQKLKKYPYKSAEININPRPIIISHGIQSAFIGYFVALFFNFDTFSTYLISFLIIGYSLHLISLGATELTPIATPKNAEQFSVVQRIVQRWFSSKSLARRIFSTIIKLKTPILGLILVLFVWFIWSFNLKPLKINKEVNWATIYAENKKCQEAINKMERALDSKSIIDNYSRLVYINIIKECLNLYPKQRADFAKKAIQILDEAKLSRPSYTRTWLFLGTYINIFVESNPNLEPEIRLDLLKKADAYFKRASELSPKRLEIFIGWIKTDLLSGNYQGAEEKSEQCINLNPELADCWWAKGLFYIYLGEIKKATENMEIAKEKGYDLDARSALLQLLNVYLKLIKESKETNLKNYETLADIYQKLIEYEPDNFQYHASLAYTYKTLGDYQKAVEEATQVFVISPESRINIEEFLNSIPDVSNYCRVTAENYKLLIAGSPKNKYHHFALAFLYKMMGEYQKAKEEAMIVLELWPESRANIEEFLKSLP